METESESLKKGESNDWNLTLPASMNITKTYNLDEQDDYRYLRSYRSQLVNTHLKFYINRIYK